MEVNGLPLHALVIHAAVVLAPMAAVAALVFALVPRWRWALRWPTLGLAVGAVGAVVLSYLSGEAHLDANPQLAQVPEVALHQERAEVLLWVGVAFGLVVLAAVLLLPGPSPLPSGRGHGVVRRVPLEVVVALLVVLASAGLVLYTVLTGDAGARAKWG